MTACTLDEKKGKQASICSFFGVNKRREVKDDKTAIKKKRPKLEQMYLDLGQRDFGKHMHCHTCGMMYVHGVDEDAAAHAKICNDFQYGVRLTPTPGMRILRKYSPEECILEIRSTDSRTLRNKLEAVLEIVKRELNFVTTLADHPSESITKQQSAFLYIMKNRVVGMVTAEHIQEGFIVKGNSHSERTEALIGIFQLWVHSKHRRKGFASRLVTAAREHMVFGIVVPVGKTAFSSPTELGLRFAKRYSEQLKAGKVLVYNCSSIGT